ncbi:CopL family metal-binding regulatory protein [Stenotrophomonas mori]|uniref:CopL family metal-binding regulatory protein n=1 Tax=Stenotrophomonas mori TaxID=2871096 RepID=A0ABT0SIT7_9GAMM|nr:CopL family metal-binding regulatory protein [Stenotrophomonas mori]
MPVSRILLPLLLCLSLLASAVGSVWMATAMAMPAATVVQVAEHACCHADEGMEEAADAPAPSHCDGNGHCDCTQHCGSLIAPAPVQFRLSPRSLDPVPALPAPVGVRPDQLNRPPIA